MGRSALECRGPLSIYTLHALNADSPVLFESIMTLVISVQNPGKNYILSHTNPANALKLVSWYAGVTND
jgi:hypothetical protein